MAALSRHRIAILATDGFEELELTEPLRALRAAGAHVDVISLKEGTIRGVHQDRDAVEVQVDRILGDTVLAEQYDALVIPGGAANASALSMHAGARRFVLEMDKAEKPIASICHGPWVLISAGIIDGRRLTGYPEIKQDLVGAGAEWVDCEVVVHDNLITSRTPADLAAFNTTMIERFSKMQPMISAGTRHVFSRARIA